MPLTIAERLIGINTSSNAEKKFSVVYADPPWQYKTSECLTPESILNGNPNQHYPTMKLKDLQKVQVRSICEEDALCFMWVVSPMLDDGIATMEAWGFSYSTIAFVWHKQHSNPGHYTLSECEICIVGKRGRFPMPRGARNIRQFLSELRGRHSAKPAEIRDRITAMFPTQNKIELFARNETPGWSVWGNEVENKENITLPLE